MEMHFKRDNAVAQNRFRNLVCKKKKIGKGT